MQGYRGIALFAGNGRALPFRHRQGGDQMITNHAPAVVPVPPGGAAYAAINGSG
jgi:hypothetical protein